ncbi:MAG: hypothetical protein AAGA48_14195 [Myxococcota bacterium]
MTLATLGWVLLLSCGKHAPPCHLISFDEHHVVVKTHEPLVVTVAGNLTPVHGRVVQRKHEVLFQPTFRFAPQVRYQIGGPRCRLEASLPEVSSASATVTSVLPDAPTLPENTLRLYVYFSAPMVEGFGLDAIRLLDRTEGVEVTGVFFDPRHELWSSDHRRLTLLFDPGRVKTGLAAHERLGRALQSGHQYQLEIQGGWPTIEGQTLGEPSSFAFTVGPAVLQALDASTFRASKPPAGTQDPLVVDFGRPVDHVSTGRFVQVLGPDGHVVPGTWALPPGAHRAQFRPHGPWVHAPKAYQLWFDHRFEDVAGNTFEAAFDHAQGAMAPVHEAGHRVALANLLPFREEVLP